MMRIVVISILITSLCAYSDIVRKPEDVFPSQYKPPKDVKVQVKDPFKDSFNRDDPDGLFKGFFPIWSAILVCVAFIFLLIAICGLIGYWFGCRNPHREFIKRRKEKAKMYKDTLRDDYASLGMMDYSENLYEKPYRN